jgi:hypothetical protein
MTSNSDMAGLTTKAADLTLSNTASSNTTPYEIPRASLLGISRELRDRIYNELLVVPEHKRVEGFYPGVSHRPARIRVCLLSAHHTKFCSCEEGFANCRPILPPLPAVLQTCGQIRDEADKIFFSKNEFVICLDAKVDGGSGPMWPCVDWDLRTLREDVEEWVSRIGGVERLRHLRDLTVEVDLCLRAACCHGKKEVFRLYFEEGKMVLKYPSFDFCCQPARINDYAMQWYFAVTNWRRRQKGWIGKGIVDFLIGDAELWETWFWSFPDYDELQLEYTSLSNEEDEEEQAEEENEGKNEEQDQYEDE